MRSEEAVEQYQQRLWDDVSRAQFPSPPMLDRLEGALRDRKDVEAYLDLLFDKAQGQYPSLQILARIRRAAHAVAVLEQRDRRHGAAG